MIKNEKNEKNSRKITIFHFLENCNFPRVFFHFFMFLSLFSIFFIFYHFFLSVFIIFYHFSSIPALEAKIFKKL